MINKKNYKKILLTFFFFILTINHYNNIICGGIIDVITRGMDLPQPQSTEFGFGEIGKTEQQLKALKNDLIKIKEKDEEFKINSSKKISEITTETKKINAQIINSPKNIDFLNSKLEALQETYQDVKNIQTARKQQISTLEEHIKLLETYLKDPNFKDLTAEFNDPKKFYSFDDLQKINELNLFQEEKIKLLNEQKQNIEVELKSNEQTTDLTKENYEKKAKEREIFKKNPDKISTDTTLAGLNKEQRLELLTIQENLLKNKRELNDFKISEIKEKLELIKSNLFLENSKINILKRTANEIKPTIKISESSIKHDKAILEKQKTENIKNTQKYKSEIDKISKRLEFEKKQIEKISKEYKIPVNNILENWEISPITKQDFSKTIAIGNVNENISLLNKEKDLNDAQIERYTDELYQLKINSEIKESFYKIETKKFNSEKEIQNEIRKYSKIKLDITAKVARLKEKINITKENLKNKNKSLENLTKFKSKLNGQLGQKQSAISTDLELIDSKIKQQIKFMQDTIDIYENIISINNKIEKQTIFITSSLEQQIGMWYRPAYAIKFEKISSVIPELKLFFSDFKNHFYRLGFSNIAEKIRMSIPKDTDLLNLFLMLIFYILLIFFIKLFVPKIAIKVIGSGKKNTSLQESDSLLRFFAYAIGFILDFISKYIISISIWIGTLFFINSIMIPDRYITILFYFISIVFLTYLANRALKHFEIFNKKYNILVFIDQKYQNKFINCISIIIYSTIILQLFRQAFELGIYYHSQLPALLSALNWIICQIALILLITKDLVQKIIPQNWGLNREQFNNFYHFILFLAVVIIIMVNPYIGLGRLLLYGIQRTLLSMIIIICLIMLHKLGKNFALKLIFKTDDETILSRFAHGKKIYGTYVITSFLFLIFVGIILGSYIWGLGITVNSIYSTLGSPIFTYNNNVISTNSLLIIVALLIIGIIFSNLTTKYVLAKIFDLLSVDPGIQFTLTTVLKYTFITFFTVIGFNIAGLGAIVKWLLVTLIIAAGWMLQEPLKDFIYYFIILTQRPLKIGDYIRLSVDSKDIDGVVRKITPRTVIIKSRNSETISIPNSKLLTGSITNFNYHSLFIAFDDIIINISFKHDPELIKKIILDVLDTNQNILKSPRPVVRLDGYGESGFIFSIRGFINARNTLDMWDISSSVKIAIVKALKENHIEIGVPVSIWKSME